MIAPTRRAIWATAAGAPIALIAGVLAPAHWTAGLAWPATMLLLILADAMLSPRGGRVALAMPKTMPIGGDAVARIQVSLPGARAACEVAIGGDPLLLMADEGRIRIALDEGEGEAALALFARRRGTARIGQIWLRWQGPLGLVWTQRRRPDDAATIILPDIRPVRENGARIFERHALQGLLAQVDRGDGMDFDALVEYRSGMDRRAIDWKQSARHRKLHAKEFRAERNNQIVFAIDCGRQMSEPVDGLPRIDRAVSAMLLTAWIALKLGDRAALHAFDSRPRIASGLVGGPAGFGALQSLAAEIDYGSDETNYTFALTTLATRLKRRSMIVLFTEFTDITSAEYLVRAAARLVETHLLLVVVLRDDELRAFIDKAPDTADDLTRAVTAAALLRDRQLVLLRLRHLGVHIVESPHAQVAEQLIAAYVDLKRRGAL